MSTHQTDALYTSESQIHRALVQYSSTATGEIQVIIPSVTGLTSTVPISYFGREAHPFENDWVVPNVGSSIVVCREDEDYTSVYWLNTTYNPVRADIGEPNDDDQDNPTQYGFGPDGQIGSGAGFELMTVTPTSAGLYLSSTHMGYWTSAGSGAWRTYMDYFGNFYLTGSGNATHGLTWTASTNTLAITGNITIGNVSEVLGALGNPEANSSAQDNPANYTFGAGMDMALVNLPATPTTAGLFLGANYLGFHSGSGGAWTTYMDATGKFYLGGTSGQLQWNGSTLLIHGSAAISDTVTVGGTAASTVASGAALGALAVQDGDGSLDLTLTDGAVGGWVITTGVLTGGTGSYKIELDQANRRISAGGGRAVMRVDSDARVVIGIDATGTGNPVVYNNPTYSNSDGDVVMERTAGGTPRFSCGNKLTWDGTTLTVTGNIVVGSTTLSEGAILNSELAGADGRAHIGLPNVENLNATTIREGTTQTHVGLPNVSNLNPEAQAVAGMTTADVEITDGHIRAGQTAFNSGTGFFLGKTTSTVPKFSVGSSANYMTWDGSALNVKGSIRITGSSTTLTEDNTLNINTDASDVDLGNVSDLGPQGQAQAGLITGTTITGGGITLDGGGVIKGGQTGYDSGIGFFLGYSSGYKFSIGNAGGNKLTWDGSALTIKGDLTAGTIGIGTNSEFSVASNGQWTVGPNGTTKLRVQPSVSSNFIFNNAAALEFYEGSTVYGYIQGDTQTINLFGGSATLTGVLMGSSDNYVGVFQAWTGKTYGVVLTAVASGHNKILLNATTGVEISSQSGTPPTGGTLYNHNGVLKWNGTDLTANTNTTYTAGTNVTISAGNVISSTDTNTTYLGSTSINLVGTTFSHGNTSSQASSNNSGQTFIQDITLDTYGHITGLNEATVRGPLEGWWGSAGGPTYSFNGDTNTGMYRAAADTIGFSSAGYERMRITDDGSVGIGTTTTPTTKMYIKSSDYEDFIALDRTGNAYVDQIIYLTPSYDGANNTALHFNIGTDSTKMIITEEGKVGIGRTPGYTLDVQGNIYMRSWVYLSSGGQVYPRLTPWETYNGSYPADLGNSTYYWRNVYLQTTVWASDVNSKSNIADATYGLDFVKQLRPVTYTTDGATGRTGARTHHGFIAQEVETLLGDAADSTALWTHGLSEAQPEREGPDGEVIPATEEEWRQGLRYEQFIPILTKAIQDLSTKLEAAESRIAVLEAS